MEYGQIVKFNGVVGRVVTDKEKFYFHPATESGRYIISQLHQITDETIEPIDFQDKILCIEHEFNWGPVIKTHVIGDYQIIEYMDNGEIKFSPHINFRSCHTTYTSLDIALIGAIANNSLEINEAIYATICILRILKKPEW